MQTTPTNTNSPTSNSSNSMDSTRSERSRKSSTSLSSNTSIKKLTPSHTKLIKIDETHCTIINASDNESSLISVEQQMECKQKQFEKERHQNIKTYSKRMSISIDQHLPLLSPINTNSDHATDAKTVEKKCFAENGFIQLDKICDTLQGAMFNAKSMDGTEVVVKKTDKILYDQRISIQDGMSVIVEENIIKEAIILHHLTVDNKPTNDYIAKFIKFFENDQSFYLVLEKAGNINLADFNAKAHELMAAKKLKLKYWKKIVKYIFWQLSAIIYWLHNDMHCSHLELNMKNVMVMNGNFIQNKEDGSYTVDPNIKIKLVDFGLSEVFETEDFDDEHDADDEYAGNPFECLKHGITDKHYLSAPRVFADNPYDARKSDIWCLGIILYQLAVGMEPYKSPNINDKQFYKVKHQNIMQLIEMHGKQNNVNVKMVNLMCNMLNIREKNRFDCGDILKDQWLGLYYAKYKSKIDKKSQYQLLRNKAMKQKLEVFPYYKAVDF